MLGWLGIAADGARGQAVRTELAPWQAAASGALFRDGPPGGWAASYLAEQGSGLMLPRGGIDVVLVSPHPDACDDGRVWQAMKRAAQSEGRSRIAVIAGEACAAARGVDGIALSLSDALQSLSGGAIPWDAIIVNPEDRPRLFAALAQASGVQGPWPMLRHEGSTIRIGAETAEAGAATLALDAHCLIQALTLPLREAGCVVAARRLYDAWARLRDTGVTTPGRGQAGPYASVVSDSEFVAMICRGMAQSKRDVRGWKALTADKTLPRGSQMPPLRVVVRNDTVLPEERSP